MIVMLKDTYPTGYLSDHQFGGEYRDADRPVECDVFRTCSKMVVSRKLRHKEERPLKRFGARLKKMLGNSDVFRAKRFTNNNRGTFFGKRQAEIATGDGAKLFGDYEQRRPVPTTDGMWACCECGRTSRTGGEFLIHLDNVKKYKVANGKCGGIWRREGSHYSSWL